MQLYAGRIGGSRRRYKLDGHEDHGYDYRYGIHEVKRGPDGQKALSHQLAEAWGRNKQEAISRFLESVQRANGGTAG